MNKPPAFQFYAKDFLEGTADFTLQEVGIYIRLLCHQWERGGLPKDPQKLCLLASCTTDALASVVHKFSICEDGALRNERLEIVRLKQQHFIESRSKNARKGWIPEKKDARASSRASIVHEGSICYDDALQFATSIANKDISAGAKTDDSGWLMSLTKDPAYLGIDVPLEFKKASRWCKENKKVLTRRRFINWLNRADRAILSSSTAPPLKPPLPEEITEVDRARFKSLPRL